MGKKAPPPPDYAAASRAQGEANKDSAIQTAVLSNPNIVNHLGSSTTTWGAPSGGFNMGPGAQNQQIAGGLYNDGQSNAPQSYQSGFDTADLGGADNSVLSAYNAASQNLERRTPMERPSSGIGNGVAIRGRSQPNVTEADRLPYQAMPVQAGVTGSNGFNMRGPEGTRSDGRVLAQNNMRNNQPNMGFSGDAGNEGGNGNQLSNQIRQNIRNMSNGTPNAVSGVPQATVTQRLSPTEQAKYDRNANLDLRLLDTATSGLGRVNNMMDTPFDMSQVNDFETPNYGDQSRNTLSTAGMQDFSGIDLNSLAPEGSINSSGFRDFAPLNADGMQNLTGINTDVLSPEGSINSSSFNDFSSLNSNGLGNFQGVNAGELSPTGQLQNLDQRNMQGSVGGQEDVFQAMVARRGDEFRNQREQMESDLISRGFTPGTEGYRSRMAEIDEQQNDFNLGARVQAGQEQERLFNMESRSRDQDFGQNAQVAQFAQQLRAQGMNEQQIEAQINNQIRGQQFNERNATSQNAMAERGQRFNEQERTAQFAQQLRASGLNEQQVQAQINQQIRGQQFGERGAVSDDARAQRGQQFQEQERMAVFQQGLRSQGLNEQQVQARTNAAIRSQQFGERGAQASFNQSEQNRVAQQERASQGANDSQRAQQIQEQAYLRQLPLNEINALRTGTQANMPQFQAYTGANVAPPPVFDASVAKGNYDMSAFQAGPDIMGGLFSLGGAALGGPLGAKAGGFAAGLMGGK